MELNELAPDFVLPDLDGRAWRLRESQGRIVILNFWSCECPHSERTDRQLLALYEQRREDLALVSIAANQIESAEAIAAAAQLRRLPIVLMDRLHVVADLYGALTTPQAFVLDRDGRLRYRGAADDVNFRQRRPTRFYVDEAVEALLHGRLPSPNDTPPHGCAIVREAVE